MKTETKIKLLCWFTGLIFIIVILLALPLIDIIFIEAPFYFLTGRNLLLEIGPGRTTIALVLFVVDMLIVLLYLEGIEKFIMISEDIKKELGL